ncbi:hypothetical protein CQ009_03700 [Pseudomonas sp. MYb2]|jgi:hypothetical protein|uniref:hypothetical protein n=1 Tax=unclassified Pseudomonas TaxID=196821 RepID=UPI000D00DF5C|nr:MULTISPECIES: hypothetical protein [unclassified Pseudomonas]PRB50036.1 hypothetical protein CQ025_10605 [Pseudomonas sp. MYb3]PRC36674.1 hypothetical protein CQ009_03700 [Pseudomonas sp. MYb2]
MERYKFLYEFSKKTLDEEVERYRKLDEKAAKFLNILSVIIVGYTALISASKPTIITTNGSLKVAFITLIIITYIALFSAWHKIFRTIRLTRISTVEIDDTAISIIEEEDMLTIYSCFANYCREAITETRRTLTQKARHLELAYKEICCATWFLSASISLYFLISLYQE